MTAARASRCTPLSRIRPRPRTLRREKASRSGRWRSSRTDERSCVLRLARQAARLRMRGNCASPLNAPHPEPPLLGGESKDALILARQGVMERVPAPLVATYTFVNPIIAVVLGSALLGEQLTTRAMSGSVLVIGSVIAVWCFDRAAKTLRQSPRTLGDT